MKNINVGPKNLSVELYFIGGNTCANL